MAKATARCTCEKCGCEFTKTATLSSRKEADSWEEWAKANYTLCRKCYGEAIREEEAKRNPACKIAIITYQNGFRVYLSLEGDTYTKKDSIKTAGFKFNDIQFRWEKVFDIFFEDYKDDLNELVKSIEKAKELGFEIKCEFDEEIQQYIDEKLEQYSDQQLIKRPKKPEIIEGFYWNEKIYGGKNKSIYLEGKKVELGDDQVTELENYCEEINKWRSKRKYRVLK